MSDQVVSLADRYADAALDTLPVVPPEQVRKVLAGAFLSFLEDIFALIESADV